MPGRAGVRAVADRDRGARGRRGAAGQASRNAAELLARVGLSDVAARRVGGFSRGMRARLGLAAGLIGEPALLLADEPAAALDPAGRVEIVDLIAGLETTVIVSSHDLADVERICDRIGVLVQGRLVYQGDVATLLTKASSGLRVVVRPPAEALRARAASRPVGARRPRGRSGRADGRHRRPRRRRARTRSPPRRLAARRGQPCAGEPARRLPGADPVTVWRLERLRLLRTAGCSCSARTSSCSASPAPSSPTSCPTWSRTPATTASRSSSPSRPRSTASPATPATSTSSRR